MGLKLVWKSLIIVWKFDRFARSVSHLLHALEEFNHLGIRFISVQDQVDTQSPMGRAMFTIIGAMAELESSLISERVKAGMAAVKNRGKKIGRPRTPSYLVNQIEKLAKTTHLSITEIVVGQIVKCVQNNGLGTKFDQNNGFPVWGEKLAKETTEHAGIE